MKYIRFLNILADNKHIEMVLDYNGLIFKYTCDSEYIEEKVNYSDICNLSVVDCDDTYFLSIETTDIVFEWHIDSTDLDNINKCKLIYEKSLPIMIERYTKENLNIEFNENTQGKLINFRIEEIKHDTKDKKNKSIIVLILALFVIILGVYLI